MSLRRLHGGVDGPIRTSFAAVTAASLTASSTGGIVDVRALGGTITASNRAFESAGRFHNATESLINLEAVGNIDLTRPGATSAFNPVVDSAGDTGGTNRIRSYAGGISIGTGALVTADVVCSNTLTSATGVTNNGTVSPAPTVVTDTTKPAPDALWADCATLDLRTACVCVTTAALLDVSGTVARLHVRVRDWAGVQALVCGNPKASRVRFG